MAKLSRKPSRDRILESAARVFGKRGYADTSLRQLMAASRTSTTAFYARFESKESVLRELVLRMIRELEQRATRDLATAQSLEDGFVKGVEALVAVLGPKRSLVRLAMTEAASSSDINTMLARIHEAFVAMLSAEIRHLHERGRIEDVDVDATAWALVGAVNLQIQRWAVWEAIDTPELEAALRRTARALTPIVKSKQKTKSPRKADA